MLPKSTKKAINLAIPKATRSSSLKAPKEKHVKNLVGATLTRDPAVVEEILRGLCKRLEKDNWVVVLKTLMVFHRIFRDGDVSFVEALRTRSAAVFGLKRFSVSAPSGSIYTLFVQKYAKYLEENVSVLRLIGFNFERQKDSMKGLDAREAFKRVPKLQSQLNALLNCKMRQHHIGRNGLIISTYMLLLKDSLVLYPMLNVGVIGLIDQVFKMRKKEAQRVLEVYQLFVKETAALINLYEISRSFTDRLPPIHPAKSSLIDVLTSHISNLSDDQDVSSDQHQSQHNGKNGQSGFSDDFFDGGGDVADMEDHLMTTNASFDHPSTSSSKGSSKKGGKGGSNNGSSSHYDDDSDTSSDSSDDDEAGDGGFGDFGGFGFGAPSHLQQQQQQQPPSSSSQQAGLFPSSHQQQTPGQFDFGSQQPSALSSDPRASFGPNSFAFLAAQAQTSNQGWDIFDRSFASGGGGHQQQQAAEDPFAAFSSLSVHPNATTTATSNASPPPQAYSDRVAAAKSGISQVYLQQQTSSPPPTTTSNAFDNPFDMSSSSSQASISPNPFGGSQPHSPAPTTTATATTTTNAPSSGSYNPFL